MRAFSSFTLHSSYAESTRKRSDIDVPQNTKKEKKMDCLNPVLFRETGNTVKTSMQTSSGPWRHRLHKTLCRFAAVSGSKTLAADALKRIYYNVQ